MSSTAAIAVCGMGAALSALGSAAHNIANADTDGLRRQVVRHRMTDGGGVTVDLGRVDAAGHALERDVVAQLMAKNAFLANLAVFRTSDAMAGSLLSLRA
jgi:flagellar hook protein FlgE